MKKFLSFMLMAALLLGMTACGGGDTATPTATAQKAYELMQKKDWKGLAQLVYIDEDKSAQEIEEGREQLAALFTLVGGELDKKGGIKSWKIVEENTDGDKCKVTCEVTYGDGTTKKDDNDLQKGADGKWYITIGK